ncbi:MAG: CocE/NonD family hydrolase, partial [Thermomicrobiales bacterium]
MSDGAVTLAGMGGVTVEREVPLTMGDGVTLYADIYRPSDEGPHPVLLIRLPYDKRQALNISYAHPAWYARQGYVVVCQDVRGRYASEGDFYPFLHEASDGVATVEWASSLPGTTGQVGMYGFSYGGATQLLSAVERPQGLAALSPCMTASQYYEGWTYNRGAFALGFAASWAMSLGIANAARRGDNAAAGAYGAAFSKSFDWDWVLPVNIYPPLQGEDTRYFFDWLEHDTYDDYWKRWSIDEDYSRITVPALHIAGWYDIFVTGTVRNYQGLRDSAGTEEARRNQKLIIGPWYHIPWQPLVNGNPLEAASAVVDDFQIAWFDAQLKGQPSSLLDAPVTIWLLGEEKWVDLDDWPPTGASEQAVYLHSHGRANSRFGDGWLSEEMPGDELADIFTFDPGVPNQIDGGHSCCFPDVAPMGPADQEESEVWTQVLVYTTEPLAEHMLIIGEPYVVLFATTSAVDTDWTARLCIVDEDDVSVNLQEGIVRARFRESLEAPTWVEPGKVYEYR